MILPDVLKPNLRVVFCGTAAGHASAQRGAYYAHPGNRFYRILHESGLTSRLYQPSEFSRLLEEGIGLTDVNKTESGNDHELSAHGFDRRAVHEKIMKYQPEILAFTSKRAAREFLGLRASETLSYGKQKQQCGRTVLYVMPSTSGAAAASWDASCWHELAAAVRADSESGKQKA